MNALRIRTQALYSTRKYAQRFSQTTTRESRLYSSNLAPENTPHTPDTYQKDDVIVPPASTKTHVVSDHTKTQRPFEPPTGSYTVMDSSRPYDLPASHPEEDKRKLKYGGIDSGGAGVRNVRDDGSQAKAGKQG